NRQHLTWRLERQNVWLEGLSAAFRAALARMIRGDRGVHRARPPNSLMFGEHPGLESVSLDRTPARLNLYEIGMLRASVEPTWFTRFERGRIGWKRAVRLEAGDGHAANNIDDHPRLDSTCRLVDPDICRVRPILFRNLIMELESTRGWAHLIGVV